VPGAIAGLALDKWAETVFRSPFLVASTLAGFGLLLGAADRGARPGDDAEEVSLRDALLIGLAQAVAIVPGSSRSGVTITMALFLGHRRASAARFSFLLALPITLGAALVKVPDLFHSGADPAPIVAGVLAAAVSGILAIRVLLAYVRTKDYRPFVYYRVAFALLLLALLLARGGELG
jgi:undecaprenyl-diphosphatase